MKNIIIGCMFFTLIGCSTSLKTSYSSKCILYGKPEYILYLDQNNDFRLISYMNDTIKGKWFLSKRKIILKSNFLIESEKFNLETDSILPNTKYTDFEGCEYYVIRNKKLFFISKNGVEDKCFYY